MVCFIKFPPRLILPVREATHTFPAVAFFGNGAPNPPLQVQFSPVREWSCGIPGNRVVYSIRSNLGRRKQKNNLTELELLQQNSVELEFIEGWVPVGVGKRVRGLFRTGWHSESPGKHTRKLNRPTNLGKIRNRTTIQLRKCNSFSHASLSLSQKEIGFPGPGPGPGGRPL